MQCCDHSLGVNLVYKAARAACWGFLSNPVTRFGKFKGSVDIPDGTKHGCTNWFVVGWAGNGVMSTFSYPVAGRQSLMFLGACKHEREFNFFFNQECLKNSWHVQICFCKIIIGDLLRNNCQFSSDPKPQTEYTVHLNSTAARQKINHWDCSLRLSEWCRKPMRNKNWKWGKVLTSIVWIVSNKWSWQNIAFCFEVEEESRWHWKSFVHVEWSRLNLYVVPDMNCKMFDGGSQGTIEKAFLKAPNKMNIEMKA